MSNDPRAPRKRSHAAPFPLASFDPRFREVMKRAAVMDVPLRIEFKSKKEAQAFQSRAHTFRKRARETGDSDSPILERVRISLKENWLEIVRQDSQWDDVFKRVLPTTPRLTSLKKDPLDDF